MFDYFTFKGRINRASYWGRIAVILIIDIVLNLTIISFYENSPDLIHLVYVVIWVISSWAIIATIVKRLHDIGLTGWLWLILLIPIIGFPIFFTVIGLITGNSGANKYGISSSIKNKKDWLKEYEKGV